MSTPDSIDLLRKDLVSVTTTISGLVAEIREQGKEIEELNKYVAVQAEREKSIKDHLSRLDASFASLASLGRYFLFAFCSSLIGAFVLWIVKGGLNVTG